MPAPFPAEFVGSVPTRAPLEPSRASRSHLCLRLFLNPLALARPFQAYDQHLNMILGDVEETVTAVEIDDETYEEIIKARRHRGAHVLLHSYRS